MNTFQLTCFLTVAEYLNFSQAAEHLHVTHPAVSQQIRSLEKELNVRLFDRSTRSVRLTEEGQAFLNDAQQIVSISEQAKKRYAGGASPEGAAYLTIGTTSFACMMVLSGALQLLRGRFPKLHPQLQVIPFRHIYKALEDGELDAVAGVKEDASLKIHASYQEAAKVPLVCLCPKDHPLAGKSKVSLDDLTSYPLALLRPSKDVGSHPRLQKELMDARPLSMLYLCEMPDAVLVLVKSGYAVSVLPKVLVPEDPGLCRIPVQGVEPVSFGLYCRSLTGRPEIRAFLECLQESLS